MFKIAIVTKNKKNVTGSFGSAKFFKVFTLEDNRISNEEIREIYKDQLDKDVPELVSKNDEDTSKGKFSLNVVDKSKEKHRKIAKSISDCNVVVARSMCANAWDSIEQFNMKPYITDNKHFEETVQQYIDGTLKNNREKIH